MQLHELKKEYKTKKQKEWDAEVNAELILAGVPKGKKQGQVLKLDQQFMILLLKFLKSEGLNINQ